MTPLFQALLAGETIPECQQSHLKGIKMECYSRGASISLKAVLNRHSSIRIKSTYQS